MARVAVDFGTSNTVVARFSESVERPETLEIPGISTAYRFRPAAGGPEEHVHLVPSLIHFAEGETLIGEQVAARGLADHPDTLRWMKRSIAHGAQQRRRTAQGFKAAAEAGEEFLGLLLRYAGDRISLGEDEFTFTAPVESFEDFQEWLRGVCERLGIRRLRLLDEPTACVLGYQGAVRGDDRFMVFDFGGGTLDVAVLRIDLAAGEDRKAVQLGQAGRDLGGMDIDRWLADDFSARHGLVGADARELQAVVLRQAEGVKIELSDPRTTDAPLTVLNDRGPVPRVLQTVYSRSCESCERGREGSWPQRDRACLGCLLARGGFGRDVRETVERALENAAVKAGVRQGDLSRVLVTGGTALVPAVRSVLGERFNGRLDFTHPFDAVVRGACRGLVVPILQHDYAIESYRGDRERGEYEFKPLFPIGTEYPTRPKAVRVWLKPTYDGQQRIGLSIYEVSRMPRRTADRSLVDEHGALRGEARVSTTHDYRCLNADNPTFVAADPPVVRERDARRFPAAFAVDGQRRLVVTVDDNHTGRCLLDCYPVVRL